MRTSALLTTAWLMNLGRRTGARFSRDSCRTRGPLTTRPSIISLLAAAGLIVSAAGCNEPPASVASEFAEGAFPPTLSDTEYHEDPWSATDCLTCHENEAKAEDTPQVRHVSLPDQAKQVHCRTCHVHIPGSSPP